MNLKPKKSPGWDGIHNETLRNLEWDMRAEVLDIINMSWRSGISPQGWLIGIIIPIHKSGKDKIALSSYRPVCLMSNLAKLAEGLIICRLRYDLESRKVLSPMQSGFRSCRSTSDPLNRLVSDIQGGLNRPAPAQRTLAVLLDLEKAFDKLVHQKLLAEMEVLEIPTCYAKWYNGFLRNRNYKVLVGITVSKAVRFANGIPQGSKGGPLLWILIANTISKALTPLMEKGLQHALLADDTTMWVTNQDIMVLASTVQEGLDITVIWSKKYLQPLNEPKSDMVMFTNYPPDLLVPLNVTIGGITLVLKKKVRLLGLILDSQLTFTAHVEKIQNSCNICLRQLSMTSGFDWGGNAKDVRSAYHAFIHSRIMYAASAYYPFLSETSKNKIQRIQNVAARIITGCVRSTSVPYLLLEAKLNSVKVCCEVLCAVVAEKARRMGTDDPMTVMVKSTSPPSRLMKTAESWQHVSDNILNQCGLRVGRLTAAGNEIVPGGGSVKDLIDIRNRDNIWSRVDPCTTHNAHKVRYITDLKGKCNKADPPEVWKQATEDIISALGHHNIEIWSDGGVMNKRGAGAAIVFDNDLNKTFSVGGPAGNLCSSFKAEIEGILCGLKKVVNSEGIVTKGKKVLLCTDSLSVVELLSKGPILQSLEPVVDIAANIITLLNEGEVESVAVVWGKGHVGVIKNERADALATKYMNIYEKEKTGASQKKSKVLLQAIKAAVKYTLYTKSREKLNQNTHRYGICEGNFSDLKLSASLPRKKEVWLSQLRVGKCLLMGCYRSIINVNLSPLCRWCGVEIETVTHVFSVCQHIGIVQLRVDLDFKDVTVLHKAPLSGLMFFEGVLKLLE
jgi:ribonuclease HI